MNQRPRCRGTMLRDRLLNETSCLSCGHVLNDQPTDWALTQQKALIAGRRREPSETLPVHEPKPVRVPRITRAEMAYRQEQIEAGLRRGMREIVGRILADSREGE